MKTDNQVIAYFMGEKYKTYHISWDFLMPVIERIENTPFQNNLYNSEGYSVEINACFCRISEDPITTISIGKGGSKIEATYKAVVGFIKWHNLKKIKK